MRSAFLGASTMFTSRSVVIGTLLCGFFNSAMFPKIFTLGIAGLGPMTSKRPGLMMTARSGRRRDSAGDWALADKVGIQHSFLIPIICHR